MKANWEQANYNTYNGENCNNNAHHAGIPTATPTTTTGWTIAGPPPLYDRRCRRRRQSALLSVADPLSSSTRAYQLPPFPFPALRGLQDEDQEARDLLTGHMSEEYSQEYQEEQAEREAKCMSLSSSPASSSSFPLEEQQQRLLDHLTRELDRVDELFYWPN